jgi:hypothetical protein
LSSLNLSIIHNLGKKLYIVSKSPLLLPIVKTTPFGAFKEEMGPRRGCELGKKHSMGRRWARGKNGVKGRMWVREITFLGRR